METGEVAVGGPVHDARPPGGPAALTGEGGLRPMTASEALPLADNHPSDGYSPTRSGPPVRGSSTSGRCRRQLRRPGEGAASTPSTPRSSGRGTASTAAGGGRRQSTPGDDHDSATTLVRVSMTRRVILLAVAAVVGFLIYHSVTPWGWTGQLQTPAGDPTASASYTCGPLWGSAYIHGPATTAYRLEGTPCGDRHPYQVLTAVDVLLGVVAIGFVAGWKKIRTPSLS